MPEKLPEEVESLAEDLAAGYGVDLDACVRAVAEAYRAGIESKGFSELLGLLKRALDLLPYLRCGDCYCPMGIDHPAYTRHLPRCKEVPALIEQIKSRFYRGST